MAIPAQQLVSWSTLGAQQASATTYNSIKLALSKHPWPQTIDHHVYLQGSYPNHTNIRGDSDVDVVVESTNVFYHNVPEHLRSQHGFTTGSYTWQEFRTEVMNALVNYYGLAALTDGNKSLKVAGYGNRLNADVVPCNTYRRYADSYRYYTSGITFWTRNNIQIVNFPKTHLNNGSAKNGRCGGHYKPTVRMLKNARNRAGSDFPSYFLECLTYNVPDYCFSMNHAGTFVAIINHWLAAITNGSISSFRCQNEQQMMFGEEPHQTDLVAAIQFVTAMKNLWQNWR